MGAAVTLAAWTDSVFVNGEFETGSFNVQGSVDGSTWRELDTSPGGDLVFPVQASDLTPGDTVHASLSLRVDPTDADYDATVTLLGAASAGGDGTLDTELRYSARTGVGAASCNPAGFAKLELTRFSGHGLL